MDDPLRESDISRLATHAAELKHNPTRRCGQTGIQAFASNTDMTAPLTSGIAKLSSIFTKPQRRGVASTIIATTAPINPIHRCSGIVNHATASAEIKNAEQPDKLLPKKRGPPSLMPTSEAAASEIDMKSSAVIAIGFGNHQMQSRHAIAT